MLLSFEAPIEVQEAPDGARALEMVRADGHDLVISDIMMPRMDGLSLLRELRRERPDLPVIVVTAVSDERHILQCLADGAWDYILKPFDLDHVRAAVRRALGAGSNLAHAAPGDVAVVSGGPGWLELTSASEVEYLHRFRKFTEVLLGARLSPGDREDIRLAVEELGRNAIEWGNRNERGKRVRFAFALFDDRLVFKIEDEGEGFCAEALADPSVDPIAHIERRRAEGKRPGGYGVHIVRKIMDEVSYSDRGNSVIMTKFL
jgi:CheY-like chemotaxis protein/anti-sigma regulatory factor (Ser/Thr protein kinase)